jgi:hypothetical protein
MKTEDLIQLLAADNAAPRPDLRMRLMAAALIGAALSFAILALGYGMRPGLGEMMLTWRVALKFVVFLSFAGAAAALALRLAGPIPQHRAWLMLLPAPLLLALAGCYDLAVTPPGSWGRQAFGAYPLPCLLSVPLLSALPLAATLWALREGAPAVPAEAGAAAGAMAAGIGAAIYALHCPDDSPLFLAIWYVLATAIVIVAGRAGGARILRW